LSPRDTSRRLLTGLTIVFLAAGCAGTASPDASPSGPGPTAATATSSPAPTRTPFPTPTAIPTIGEPADDGARIIAVDTNPTHLLVPTTRARDLTIDSPAVGHKVKVRLLLPAGFDAQPAARWPVLYLLHGGSGTYSDWSEYFDVEALTAPTDLLVVMPEGGDPDDAQYSDYWNRGKGGPPAYETFHLVELRQLLERNWHAGDERAIAGYSAGGYGAIEYAEHQRGMFRFAGSYSGPLDVFGPGANYLWWGSPYNLWGDHVTNVDVWKAHDPTTNAAGLEGTALYVAYGNGVVGPLDNGKPSPFDPDGASEREIGIESALFVDRLAELKIPVTVYAYGNGTHNGPYMQRDFDRSFPLILKALGL
jgi:S-formylglutathione hydrolase FrmB